MIILGVSCFFHDSAASIVQDGILIAAAEEERFTRKKHDKSFPVNAIRYCLKEAGISIDSVDYVGFYEKPLIKLERLLYQQLECFPKSFGTFLKSMPEFMNDKVRVPSLLRKKFKYKGKVIFAQHHMSHAASAFLVSPFKESAILTVDGVGEWATTTYGKGVGNKIELFKEIKFPHSLGLLYSTVTAYLGMSVNNSEYKVMGLSPYGEPKYVDKFRQMVEVADDGSYKMDMDYFVYHYQSKMPSEKFCELFGAPVRKGEELTQKHKDIAASLQVFLEETMVIMLNYLHKETKCDNLCMAGGVALNSVFNGKIIKKTPFKKVYIQPAAGDSGGAVGIAFYIYNSILGNERKYVWKHNYLGPSFSTEDIKKYLDHNKIVYSEFKSDKELIKKTVKLIYDNNVVGWFQGRMEWAPRALGSRSILSNACNPDMKDILNSKVKHRECYDEMTEILTKNGWKLFKDLNKDEEVATLNPNNNELVYQKIEKKSEYVCSGKLVYFKNKKIDLVVTTEHRLWAKKIKNHQGGHSKRMKFGFENASDLLKKEHVQIKAINIWKGKEQKYFLLPGVERSKFYPRPHLVKISMDLWLEFLGYYLSGGSFTYNKGYYWVYIVQKKKSKYYSKIKKCLNQLDFLKWNYNNQSFRTYNKQLYEYLKKFGKAGGKFIPQELLSLPKRQLRILFGALMARDGTYRPKQYKYATVSKKLADNVQELGIKLGYSVTTSKEELRNLKHNDMYYVRLDKSNKLFWVRKNQSGFISYDGKVYCVTVKKFNILCVKRCGKVVFSGNSFRPFAPVVPKEEVKKYFDLPKGVDEEPYMLFVYPIKNKWHKKIPSVTHVDGSGRVQTVSKEQNELYYEVIKGFGKLSGIPILINTSFNIRGEPIVCTPQDAYRCMMGTGIDYLVIDKFLIKRTDNPKDVWDSESIAKD